MIPRGRATVAVLLVSLVLAAAPAAPAAAPAIPAHPEPRRTPHALRFAPGEIVIIGHEDALQLGGDGAPRSSNARTTGALARYGLTRGRAIDGAPRGRSARRDRVWLLRSERPDFDPVAASRSLQATGAFRAVSPNYTFGLFYTVPNDVYIPYQWYVDDGGFADIKLPQAWDVARGDTSVSIAIIDTGVDTSHPDLASKIWHNPGEIAGNGVDDDGNGFVDDVEGWDFGVGDNDPKPAYTPDSSGIDVGFHGTFCAGLAAAATNNEEGIASAGWDCRIMALKAADPVNGITSDAVAGAFAYAADAGASVISMSFGGPGDPGVPEFFQALVDMATEAGSLCVAAAGNDGDSVFVYPAACDHVLSVAATDLDNARASFSNFGPWVDVAAPGGSMWSTLCQNYTFRQVDQLIYILLWYWDGVNPYMYGDGTSFACPLTAGVCGMVRARYPYLTPQLVAQHVIATGDLVAFDQPIGPKVNAYRAVNDVPTAVAEEAGSSSSAPALAAASPNPFEGSTEIRFVLPAESWTRLVIYDASGRLVRTLAEGTLTAGLHRTRWDGRNQRGNRVSSAVYFARLESRGVVLHSKVVLIGR